MHQPEAGRYLLITKTKRKYEYDAVIWRDWTGLRLAVRLEEITHGFHTGIRPPRRAGRLLGPPKWRYSCYIENWVFNGLGLWLILILFARGRVVKLRAEACS
jgi:hypothetical protein